MSQDNNKGRNDQAPNDQGLFALAMLLRIHGVAVEQPQLRHRLGSAAVGVRAADSCCSAARGKIA